jgi:WD40 repeat protein
MILFNENIIIGGEKKIYFIDFNNYSIKKSFNCDFNIYSINLFKKNHFLVGDRNGKIIEFNIEQNQPISIKNSHNDKIYSIVIFNNYLVSGGNQTIIKIWK